MDRDLSRSLAILIGNGVFADADRLPPIPAASCMAAMADLLASELCGWPADRILRLKDLASPSDLARRVVRAVRDARDVLLVYYVGHGARTSDGQLALALGETEADPEALPHTAMLYENLARILRGCPAATKLVILDCCHAELGNKASYQFQDAGLTETYPVDGLYFIGASKTHQKAKFDPYSDLTYFTEAFVDTVRDGVPGQADQLRLDQVFVALRARLVSGGLPEPVEAGTRGARQYPFARNAFQPTAMGPGQDPDARPDPAREARLRILAAAERAATDPHWRWWKGRAGEQALALLKVATALAADDPDRARALARQASQLAAGEELATDQVTKIALAMTAADPRRAERMVRAITDPAGRGAALIRFAGQLAATDPDRALAIARGLPDPARPAALAAAAKAIAPADPRKAAAICADIPPSPVLAGPLFEVAEACAELDGDSAEAIAQACLSQGLVPTLYSSFVRGLAKGDVDRAERVALAMPDLRRREIALGTVALWMADSQPERAERLARSLTNTRERDRALDSVAVVGAEADPERAERIARSHPAGWKIMTEVAEYMASASPDRAGELLQDAERAVAGLSSPDRDVARAHIAVVTAPLDPDRARKVALSVADPATCAETLTTIAGPRVAGSADGKRDLLALAAGRASQVADPEERAKLMTRVGAHLAAHDEDEARRMIDHAEATARTVPGSLFGGTVRDRVLRGMVITIMIAGQAARDVLSYHAERIARDISSRADHDEALASVSSEIFADDPERAERVAMAISHPAERLSQLVSLAAMHKSEPERA